MCQLCMEGYIVGVGYVCEDEPSSTCNVQTGCLMCSSDNTCSQCSPGYKLVDGNCTELECDVASCAVCENSTKCSDCRENYFLMNNECKFKTYACNVDKCISCLSSPEFCSQCEEGYYIQELTNDNHEVLAAKCVKITVAIGNNANLVKYCSKFGYMGIGTDTSLHVGCLMCMENYINVGGFCVANLTQSNYLCDVDNCEYCVQNNYCGKCEDGYYIQLFTGGQCWKEYSPLPYCKLTTIFGALCIACDDGFVLSNYECFKYDPAVTC